MPWFKVDDGFHGHPKVVELSLAAVGMWTLAGSWCAKYLTDGSVTLGTIRRLGGSSAEADELVECGLWIHGPDGFQFNDWEKYQPLKEAVEAEREAAQERMRNVRAKKKGVLPNSPVGSPEVRPNTSRSSEEVRVTPSQSHPIPAQPSTDVDKPLPAKAEGRATRIAEPFILTADMRSWAAGKYPAVDVDEATESFVDYWRGRAGAAARKLDWSATWRNSIRMTANRQKPGAGKPTPEQRARQTMGLAMDIDMKELT